MPEIDPAARDLIIRRRNRALALVLLAFVVLFFAITVVKMNKPAQHLSDSLGGKGQVNPAAAQLAASSAAH